MVLYKDEENRREVLINFIKNNPLTTHKEIRRCLHMKPERVYSGGMAEAFHEAGVSPPRTFKRMTKEEKKKIIIDYIRQNPLSGGHIIRKNTKINFLSIFKNTEDAFRSAGVKYPREDFVRLIKRKTDIKKSEIIKLIRENPLISLDKIGKLTKTHPYSLFKNTKEIYHLAGIPFLSKGDKRRMNKQKIVIAFLKNNPLATQREINSECKTHVQLIFNGGIFEAYDLSGINYPYQRMSFHGAALKEVKIRAEDFETQVALKLSGYGKVNRLVKTRRGFADIIFERNGNKTVIEVKNYLSHEISISQVKQLCKYLEDSSCNFGFLVCRKKPKKDKFLIGNNAIYILTIDELSKIPEVMDQGL